MKLNLNLKKTFLPLFLGLTIASTSVAQFSGNIEFKKTVGKIVVTYKYFVSGDNVRLEEINENGNIDDEKLDIFITKYNNENLKLKIN